MQKLTEDPLIEESQDSNDPIAISFNNRNHYNRELVSDRFSTIRRVEPPKKQSKGAAAIVVSPIYGQQQKTILTRQQLLQCADAYTNDGVVRTAINKHIDFILGKRTKFTVDLNDELTEFATPEEVEALQSELKSSEVQDLRTKIIRINKRVELHDRLTKTLISAFIFGRACSQIIRFPKSEEFPRFGEPRALFNLNTTRIVDVKVDLNTAEFQGLYYDYGVVSRNKELIPATKLLPIWIDDANLYENTLYSGMSPIWPVLNLVYANQIINDEDIPESTKTTWAKFALIYSGTSKQSVTARINDQLKAGTALVHNQEKMKSEVYDLGKDIRELTDVRRANSEFMLQCLGIPIFFMFEDVPNFATAGATIQSYKEGALTRHRTALRGVLEKYWYDPILADHFDTELEDVISLRIKVRAAFEDIIFDSFKEKVDALIVLHNAGVYDDEKVLKELGAEDMLERKRQMEKIEQEMMEQDIKQFQEQQAQQGGNGFNSRGAKPNPAMNNDQQRRAKAELEFRRRNI